MARRFVTIWFRHLTTDWFIRRQPALKDTAFVLAAPVHGKMIIKAANVVAQKKGATPGMSVADARAIVAGLEVLDDQPEAGLKLLTSLAEWCIRYTPVTAVDPPDGLVLDVSGCAHLWGDEKAYLKEIVTRLGGFGYEVRAAMADTIGAAWAHTRYGKFNPVVESGHQSAILRVLPPEALRIDQSIVDRLHKLGLHQVDGFMAMPRSVLRRRFGTELLLRLDQALGKEEEIIQPVLTIEPYQERLPCLEPIATLKGIEIALEKLLQMLCDRLQKEGKGLRTAVFKAFRIDGNIQQIDIGTGHASHHSTHLFKLFELKIATIEPAEGIELFVLEAPKVEDASPLPITLWGGTGGLEDVHVAELLDRLAGKIGAASIHRYLPAEHYWPERSIKSAASLTDAPAIPWRSDKPRPVQLLAQPERIEVTAPVPDYPPMNFRYKGKLHIIKKADGPERIEQEWWLQTGPHRDYYYVEDEEGSRYWLFRSGHYDEEKPHAWFIHGFFA